MTYVLTRVIRKYKHRHTRHDLNVRPPALTFRRLIFPGGLASAFFWGILADHVGRKKVLVVSLLLDGILTLISSLSQTFAVFAAFRFLSGFM